VRSVLGAYLEPFNIEKIDSYQIRLYLSRPEIALPEHLSHYSAVILNHRTFEGDFLRAPHGTGPFTIEVFEENGRCLLTKRNTYWRPGLPFLNQLDFMNVGWDISSRAAALAAGKIHMIDPGDTNDFEVYENLRSNRNIELGPVLTAKADVIRMRVDREPWSDNLVRRALRLCQHREKILLLANLGQGVVGHDCHVCPSHPEYCPKKIPKYDPLRARSLLEEAGYPQGLDVHLTIGDGRPEITRLAQVLQKDAARAGFRIHIQEISDRNYLDNWTTFDFGITSWPHQSLGIQALNLAYASDAEGNPRSWNETCWVDEEFQLLLDEANRTIDVGERKKIFCRLEEIQMNRGSIGISCWHNSWIAFDKTVQGLLPHPHSYLILDKVWIKK
jgi:peptide/nickel transport system substrate-binding protein